MIAIFDLDGTLALNEHRQHFLKETPKNWKAFNETCICDKPNMPIIRTMQALNRGHTPTYILSGRSEGVKLKTEKWMDSFNIQPRGLYMRKMGDYRDDREVKKEMLDKLIIKEEKLGKTITINNIIIFDDRQKVVDMWREMGLTCCQVAPGNF